MFDPDELKCGPEPLTQPGAMFSITYPVEYADALPPVFDPDELDTEPPLQLTIRIVDRVRVILHLVISTFPSNMKNCNFDGFQDALNSLLGDYSMLHRLLSSR